MTLCCASKCGGTSASAGGMPCFPVPEDSWLDTDAPPVEVVIPDPAPGVCHPLECRRLPDLGRPCAAQAKKLQSASVECLTAAVAPLQTHCLAVYVLLANSLKTCIPTWTGTPGSSPRWRWAPPAVSPQKCDNHLAAQSADHATNHVESPWTRSNRVHCND